MTRPKFKTEIKLFALTERSQGKGWQKIRQHISDKFNVKPPSVRAMEKWQKIINPETIYGELLKETKAQIPRVGAEVQIQVAQNLLPVLLKAREGGEDMEAAAWKWFFQWAENYLGKDRFIRLVKDYLSEQENTQDSSTKEMKK
jgi:hypothetical protein